MNAREPLGPAVATLLPNGFHDAFLREVHVNLQLGSVDLEFDFHVGLPSGPDRRDREAMRSGTLHLRDVTAMGLEPPHPDYRFSNSSGAKVDGDFGVYPGEPEPPRDGLVRLWFFVSTWDSRLTFTFGDCDLTWTT